jgi:hypothetical protein
MSFDIEAASCTHSLEVKKVSSDPATERVQSPNPVNRNSSFLLSPIPIMGVEFEGIWGVGSV